MIFYRLVKVGNVYKPVELTTVQAEFVVKGYGTSPEGFFLRTHNEFDDEVVMEKIYTSKREAWVAAINTIRETIAKLEGEKEALVQEAIADKAFEVSPEQLVSAAKALSNHE